MQEQQHNPGWESCVPSGMCRNLAGGRDELRSAVGDSYSWKWELGINEGLVGLFIPWVAVLGV